MQRTRALNRRHLISGFGMLIAAGIAAEAHAAEANKPGTTAASSLRDLFGSDLSKPVGVLNLLRFKERAKYEDGSEPGISGAAAYVLYGKGVRPILKKIGASVVFNAPKALIRPAGEWDKVFVMRYPTRQIFLDMVASEEYRRHAHHRTAAVADARAVPMELTDEDFD